MQTAGLAALPTVPAVRAEESLTFQSMQTASQAALPTFPSVLLSAPCSACQRFAAPLRQWRDMRMCVCKFVCKSVCCVLCASVLIYVCVFKPV